jgi:hypothetical protein
MMPFLLTLYSFRYYNRNRVPYVGTLLASHFIESLAFVPIMIGVLMFLFEFFDDQMLAFMVRTPRILPLGSVLNFLWKAACPLTLNLCHIVH